MSEIRATTISDSAGTGPIALTKQSCAKMFANFNGNSTPTARKSLNLSSITDLGAGQYTLTFTNAFADSDYASPSAGADSTGTGRRIACPHADDTATTTSYKLQIVNDGGTRLDGEYIHTATFGDLA